MGKQLEYSSEAVIDVSHMQYVWPTLAHIPEGCHVSVLHLHSIVVSEAVWMSPVHKPVQQYTQLQVIKLEEHKKDGTSIPIWFAGWKKGLQPIFDNEKEVC